MNEKVRKDEAIKYINTMVNNLAGSTASLIKNSRDAEQTRKGLFEFKRSFENACNSSDPFIHNVEEMRKQGMWLPEKINATNTNAVYFNYALGVLITVPLIEVLRNDSYCGFIIQNLFSYIKEFVDGKKVIVCD